MKLHRFFVSPEAIKGKTVFLSDRDILTQLKKVLRLKTGDELLVLDGSGKEYLVAIESLAADVMKGEVKKVSENQNEPELKIVLCQALCKKDKFEWILQKGTEVGVSEFVPVIAERSEKLGLNKERAEKILKEAAEQSERGIIPRLAEIKSFGDVIKNLSGEKILLDKSGENIKSYSLNVNSQMLNVFVGPEGGWTDEELATAKENGAKIVSLGSRVLRTETAGMVAAAILLNK